MKSSPSATFRPAFAAAALLVAAALPLTARAGPTAGARLENNLSGSGLGGVYATPTDLSGTHQEAGAESSGPDGSMRARGYAASGAVGANAQINFHGSNSNSGGLAAIAGSSWAEHIDMFTPDRFPVIDVYLYEMKFKVSATGSVGASGSRGAGGAVLASGGASIAYNLSFGQFSTWATQSFNSYEGTFTESGPGPWGTITGSTQASPIYGAYLQLSGSATASIGNAFAFGQRSASADADFGSTLLWGGVSEITAYNQFGQVIALPEDFQLNLVGRDSGFNYWNAAPHPYAPDTSNVPDKGSAVLLLAPVLAVLAVVSRRRRLVIVPHC